jgi:hypothetical protein
MDKLDIDKHVADVLRSAWQSVAIANDYIVAMINAAEDVSVLNHSKSVPCLLHLINMEIEDMYQLINEAL